MAPHTVPRDEEDPDSMPVPGPWELILLLVIVLIIFGPGKLPDIGNAVGKGIREFRRASSDLEESVRGESKKRDDEPADERADRTH
jgi:sec-independent protein translocase protein TatA